MGLLEQQLLGNTLKRNLKHHLGRAALVLLVLCSFSARAQLSGAALEVLEEARAAASEARATYAGSTYTPDQALWRDAINAGERALRLEPDSLEVLRFLTETYSTLSWNARAWYYGLRYQDASGALSGALRADVAKAGTQLGYARYNAANLPEAKRYFERVLAFAPQNVAANIWLGRIYLEQGEAERALPYWREAAALSPKDEGVQFYLSQAEARLEFGGAASDAFQAGLQAYNDARLEDALARFEAATQTNANYKEAFAWAGRTSLELGRPEAAKTYWQRVLDLDPKESRARYFIARADDQLEWGVEAVRTFQEGMQFYDAERFEQAGDTFATASRANPQYVEAALWAARSYQEAGAPERAVPFWARVVALDPDNTRAAYFLELTRNQSGRNYGAEASSAFNRGVTAYQNANLAAALAAFEKAVAARPNYADAWAWLGRIHFDKAEYSASAEAYSRALALVPSNDSYQFFAEEAARLADN